MALKADFKFRTYKKSAQQSICMAIHFKHLPELQPFQHVHQITGFGELSKTFSVYFAKNLIEISQKFGLLAVASAIPARRVTRQIPGAGPLVLIPAPPPQVILLPPSPLIARLPVSQLIPPPMPAAIPALIPAPMPGLAPPFLPAEEEKAGGFFFKKLFIG